MLELLNRLEKDPEYAQQLFSSDEIGQGQLEILLACIDNKKLSLFKKLSGILKSDLNKSQSWRIHPGEFERKLNERLIGASGGNKKLYRICTVIFSNNEKRYSYLTDDLTIGAGEYVLAPFGSKDKLQIGLVAKARDYTDETAPYPIELTKKILCRTDAPTD